MYVNWNINMNITINITVNLNISINMNIDFNINNQYTFLASCNYIMQHSQVTHQQQERVDYIEELTFDMIVFKVGLLLK